jgi:hypothetical protein
MFFFLNYRGDSAQGAGCPVWCDVSFPAFDNTPFEQALAQSDIATLQKLSNAPVVFHHTHIEFDYFDQHRGIVFASNAFLEVLRSNAIDFDSVPIAAQCKRDKRNSALVSAEKGYSILVVRDRRFCADLGRSEVRVERDALGLVVPDLRNKNRPKIQYLYRLIVDAKTVPDVDLFRPLERPDHLIVSERLYLAIKDKELKGVGLVPTPELDLLDLPSTSGSKRIIDNGSEKTFFAPNVNRPASRLP